MNSFEYERKDLIEMVREGDFIAEHDDACEYLSAKDLEELSEGEFTAHITLRLTRQGYAKGLKTND